MHIHSQLFNSFYIMGSFFALFLFVDTTVLKLAQQVYVKYSFCNDEGNNMI